MKKKRGRLSTFCPVFEERLSCISPGAPATASQGIRLLKDALEEMIWALYFRVNRRWVRLAASCQIGVGLFTTLIQDGLLVNFGYNASGMGILPRRTRKTYWALKPISKLLCYVLKCSWRRVSFTLGIFGAGRITLWKHPFPIYREGIFHLPISICVWVCVCADVSGIFFEGISHFFLVGVEGWGVIGYWKIYTNMVDITEVL